ncbi:septum formation family protein [Paenarthrobacter sp. PH39-S1]|uniref:septum formation family protein n=1 Tax=Paenarthrobacter sp. PH39-S1 TaxID=3046204 RepID=UPI0024B8A0A1|nr:septum formation family protein [Paenarthrobacter sp. PH39-S1]MDJ0355198.1 septum formation family protein [Paenarthrobacter sp. PH39-S1]
MSKQDDDQTGADRSVGARSGKARGDEGHDDGGTAVPPTPPSVPEPAVSEDANIQLEEPHLAAAEISSEVAESTSLNEVEAEAARVAEEAQATGTMVAGNECKAPPAPALPRGDADNPWSKSAAVPAHPAPAHPAPAHPAAAGTRSGNPAGGSNPKLYIMIGLAVIGVLLIIGAIWLIVSLLSGSRDQAPVSSAAQTSAATNPEASSAVNTPNPSPSASPSLTSTPSPNNNGVIATNVPPLKWAKGDCLKSFQSASQNAAVVDCTAAHSAQLVGTYTYPAGADYPGLDALKAKATDTCNAVKLSSAANNYTYKPKSGYPSESTWSKGDRRVDCIIVDDSGENIRESLLG